MENVKAFHKQLKSIYEGKPPVSKAKMAFITKAAFKAIKFYKHIVLEVEKFAQKAPAEYKLAALYVIDSIVRQSRHQNGHENDVFGPRFAKNFKQTFTNILQCNVEDKSKVVKVLNLWQKNGTFPTELVQMLLDLSNPNNSDMKLSDVNDNGSIKKSQKEFAEEALKVVDDLLEKCGKDPQGMGINPQHYQQLEIIGRYLKQQLDNKNHKLDGSDGNSITVDAKVVTQLRELAAQLFGKVNNSNDHQSIASKNDKTKQNTPKEQTLLKDVNNDAALTGFNKKLLDFDYGDEDDESPSYNNNSLTHKANISDVNANFSSLPPIDPTIKEAAQKIFNDPGIMRELQNMTPLMCDGAKYSDDLRKQILAQQQEEFDKEIQNSVKTATHQFQYIPGLSPQQNSFPASYSNTYAMNHIKQPFNFMSNPNFSPNLKDVPLPTLPCPFPAYNKNSLSNFNSFTQIPSLMDDQTDYIRYKSITHVDGDYRGLDHDERNQLKKSSDVGHSASKDHRSRSSVSKDREYRGGKRERGRDSDRNNSKSNGGRDYDNDRNSDKKTRHKDHSPTNNSKRGSERDERDRRGKDSGGSKKRSRDSSDRKETNSQQHKSSSSSNTYHGPVAPKSDCITVLSRTLWIGRVPKNSTESDLKQAFKEYNVTAESLQMVPPRGCAYVTFNTRYDAAKILDRMKDKYKLFGKTLQVNWSPFKGLKDRKNLKQYWSESLGVYYLPYDKVEINMANDYNDGGIVEWDSVPATLRANMQAELMKQHRNTEPPLNLPTLLDFPNKNANHQPFPNFNMSLPAPLPTSIPLPAQISPNFGPTSSLHDAGQQNMSNAPMQRPAPYPNMNYPGQRFPPMQIPPPPSMAQPRGPFPPNNFNRFPFNNHESLPSEPDTAGSFSREALTSAENGQPFGANSQYNGPFGAGLSTVGPTQLLMAQRQQRLMLQQQRMAAAQQLQNSGPSNMITARFQGNPQFMQQRFAHQQAQRPFFPNFRPNPQMAQMMGARGSGLNPLFLAGMQNAMRARLLMAGGQSGFNANGGHIGNQQQYPFAPSNNIACGSDQSRQGWDEGIKSKFEGEDHSNYEEHLNSEQPDFSPPAVTSSEQSYKQDKIEEEDWTNEERQFSPKAEHVEPSSDAVKDNGGPGLDGVITESTDLEIEVAKVVSEDVINMIDNSSDQKEGIFEDSKSCENNADNSKEQLENSQQSNVDIEGDV